MGGLYLTLTLIVMGGVISFLGDRVGMRVGRLRLRLFGLRPKHSSVIVTILTGTLIAASSLAVLAVASQDVRDALFRISEIQSALAQTYDALLASEDELAALKKELSGHREEVAAIAAARDEAVRERDAALAERQALIAEIEAVTRELDKASEELEEWKRRVASLREMGATLEDSIAKMQGTEERLRSDISRLTEQYLALEDRLRAGEFVYLKDEIVAAEVIESGPEREKVEESLVALLERADAAALERGARIDGKERAIELGDEEHFFRAVEVLAAEPGRWVARVVAMQNTVAGEPLRVYFHLFPETKIYSAGEVIAKRTLDGGRVDHETQLLGLLEEVNRRTLAQGMISTDGQVGRVSGEEFVEALLALKRHGGRAEVRAVAPADVWNTRGPLQVELQVVPVAG